MAERRMFSKVVISSDEFLDMPSSAKILYFYLMAEADDDGFVDKPKGIMRLIGASQDDMKILLAKKYVFSFDTGIVVIRHWKVHNYIRKDLYKPTKHIDEQEQLSISNNLYQFRDESVTELSQGRNDSVALGKDRIGKDRIEIEKEEVKEETVGELVRKYTTNKDLLAAIKNFIEMRKAKKTPTTHQAAVMFLNKLSKLTSDDNQKIAILNQSTERGWTTVYALKDDYRSNQSPQHKESNTWVNPAATSDDVLERMKRECMQALEDDLNGK